MEISSSFKALFAVLTVALVFAVPAEAQGFQNNVIPNAGFEDLTEGKPTGWNLQSGDEANIDLLVDETEAHSGSRSVRCDNRRPVDDFSAGSAGSISLFDAPVSGGKKYTFGFWTKMQDATRTFSQIFWLDTSGQFIETATGKVGLNNVVVDPVPYVAGAKTHDWQQLQTKDILVPESVAGKQVGGVWIGISAQGGGTYWYDDVFLYQQVEPLFPDLQPDGALDYQDQLDLPDKYNPEGFGFNEVGHGEIFQLMEERRTRESFTRGVPFREYYPLIDGSVYHYVSIPDNNIDYFDQVISGPLEVGGREAYRVSIRNAPPEDVESEQSAVLTATGPVAILQVIIDTPIDSEGYVIPAQTIDLTSDPLVIGVERLEEGVVQTTSTSASILIQAPGMPAPASLPGSMRLESEVTEFGTAVEIQDASRTVVSETVTITSLAYFTLEVPGVPLPVDLFYAPGSGILIFLRDIGLVQMQEFTDPNTPGEVFPLSSATIGGVPFPPE